MAGGFTITTLTLVLLRLIRISSISHIVLLYALLSLLSISMALVMTPVLSKVTYLVRIIESESPGLFRKGGGYA